MSMHGEKMENAGITKCNAAKKDAKNNCMRSLILWNDRKSMK